VTLDNSDLVARFCPAQPDGDTFIYTEMLDRSKRKGNNGVRLLKTFYHRSVDEFRDQLPTIKELCELSKVRACTRLSPRSFAKVGREFTRLVVDASLTANWAGMKSLYNRACGIVAPNTKLWLWDVDEITDESVRFGDRLRELGMLVECIPSRRGVHLISKPFDHRDIVKPDGYLSATPTIQLHKDNPTNLYIPDGAA
jgi:hypothetical protein